MAVIALAESAAGAGAERRYELTGRLLLTLLGRLARAAATGAGREAETPAIDAGEEALMAAVARAPAQAVFWAEAAARAAATLRHARAVNLDPAQTIIDIFLDLDATLARARGVA